MGDKTGIEWTNATWNPTTGCDRISPGCDHCYALTMAGRLKLMGQANYQNDGDPRTSGPGFALTVHPDALGKPLHWKAPQRIFVNSMSDLFHPEVPDDFIIDVFAVMALAPQHAYQVLTKRPQAMSRLLSEGGFADAVQDRMWQLTDKKHGLRVQRSRIVELERRQAAWLPLASLPLPGVWLGTSIENDRYTFRANHLRATPAAVRFLSLEPLLGPLPSLDLTGIDWAIVGAESGKGARPMDEGWVRDIRDRCVESGTALFVKQLSGGFHAVKSLDEFPVDLRVREYPETVTA